MADPARLAQPASTDVIVLRSRPWRYLGLLAVAVVLESIRHARNEAYSIVTDALVAACAIGSVVAAWPNASYLRITRDGFAIRTLFRTHEYAWRDIGRIGVARSDERTTVGFDTRAAERRPLLAAFSRATSGFSAGLGHTYGMRAEDLADLMNDVRLRAHEPSTRER